MQNTTAFAPSPSNDSFVAFLEKLSQLPDQEAPAHISSDLPNLQSDLQDDMAALSYADALRGYPLNRITAASVPVTPAPQTALALDKRRTRATVFLSVDENTLLRQRATENSLSISAYVRSCVFEVEMLRAQVKQLKTALQAAAEPQQRIAAAAVTQDFTLPSPGRQPAPPDPLQDSPQRRLQPLTARPPQMPPARHANPRVQAALAEQRRIVAQQQAETKTARSAEKRPRLFGFLFGSRRSA